MKKLILLIVLLLAVSVGDVAAQSIVKDAIEVNGLRVGTHYTQEEMFAALGEPTEIKMPSKWDEYTNSYTFFYGEDCFFWIDGEFYGFGLETTRFQVNRWITVGDSIEKIDRLEGLRDYRQTDLVRLVEWRPPGGGLYDWVSVDFYYKENGEIDSISCFIHDL